MQMLMSNRYTEMENWYNLDRAERGRNFLRLSEKLIEMGLEFTIS